MATFVYLAVLANPHFSSVFIRNIIKLNEFAYMRCRTISGRVSDRKFGTTLRAADTGCARPHSTPRSTNLLIEALSEGSLCTTVPSDEDVDIVHPGARPCEGPSPGCIPSGHPVSSER